MICFNVSYNEVGTYNITHFLKKITTSQTSKTFQDKLLQVMKCTYILFG